MKGFVNILEMIIVVIALFIAFSILFPGFVYESKWSNALIILKARDLILTMDRTGELYNYSFNVSALQNFLNITIPTVETGLLAWSEVEGTIKSKVFIACNCTGEQINNLTSWFSGLRINNREIDTLICYSNLDPVNPCIEPEWRGITPDVFLIWDYKNLSNYLSSLKSFLEKGRGIVEIMDLNETQIDDVQKQIFGIEWVGGLPAGFIYYDEFNSFICDSEVKNKPCNATHISYTPWKYFHHIPIPLTATQDLGTGAPPSDTGFSFSVCGSLRAGNFYIQANITQPYCGGTNTAPCDYTKAPDCNADPACSWHAGDCYPKDCSDLSKTDCIELEPYGCSWVTGEFLNYPFWICDSNKVFFDTNLTGKADTEVEEGEDFYIQDFYNSSLNWTFSLNYIDGNKIGVSFKPGYKFHDFIKEDLGKVGGLPPGLEKKAKYPPGGPQPPGWENAAWASYEFVYPIDGNENRILIRGSQKTEVHPVWGKNLTTPAVILNSTPISRVAWISDFTEEGVGDDERLLLISLLLWASNKKAMGILLPEIRTGYKTSYINTVNRDMFEVYKFNLGLGYPF